jgi:hypothetical protein
VQRRAMAAYLDQSSHDFFSVRMGCQVHAAYGMDLAALCIKNTAG